MVVCQEPSPIWNGYDRPGRVGHPGRPAVQENRWLRRSLAVKLTADNQSQGLGPGYRVA